MYLSSRGPLSLECNAPMQYDHPNLKDYDASGIMAIIAHQVATVYLEVKNNNNLINDQQFNAKKEFSLDQLVFLFSSFREPNKIFDSYYTNEETSNFIIIYKNNIPYKIQVIRENQVVNLNKIYVTIKTIINQKDEKDVSFNFITSATNRDIAKDLLDELLLNKKNKESYEELKNAITVLCYDEYKNNSIKERFKNFIKTPNFNHLHGKGMLFTINNDGDVMMCTDHIKVDGGTEIYLMNRISQLFDQKPNLIEIRMMPHFDKIQFDLTNIQKTKLNSEFKRFIDYINKVDVIFIESKTLNRTICKELNLAYAYGVIHLMYQIAQYRTNKKFFNTYIAVDVRNFFKGRNECIRPISEFSKQFAIDFVEGKIKTKQDVNKYLENIMNEHYKRSKDCQACYGINKYMLGIKLA